MSNITQCALPGTLAEIASLTSVETAIKMARELGGRRYYFPLDPGPHHPLVTLVGMDAAQAISRVYGGDRLSIPSARPLLRWHDARRLRADGHSISEISKALGISETHVARLVAGVIADTHAHPGSQGH